MYRMHSEMKSATPYIMILFFVLSVLIMFSNLFAIFVSAYIEYRFFNTEFCIWSVCFFRLNFMSLAMSSQASPTDFACSKSLFCYLKATPSRVCMLSISYTQRS